MASYINVLQYVHREGKKGESHFPRVDREVESEKKVMTCRVRLSFSFCSFLSFRFFPTLCIHSLPSALCPQFVNQDSKLLAYLIVCKEPSEKSCVFIVYLYQLYTPAKMAVFQPFLANFPASKGSDGHFEVLKRSVL